MTMTCRSMVFAVAFIAAGSASADEWVQGTYINDDKDGMISETVFCDAGKAYVGGMAQRTYKVEMRDGKKFVVLNSNGKFTFSVSDDEQKLLPADDFTKEWFTKTSLTKDPKRKDTCNW